MSTDSFLVLLRKIRGHHPQQSVNKKFGYVANQVSQWESGRRHMSWLKFVDYCSYCDRDLKEAIQKAIGFSGNPTDIAALLKCLTGVQKEAEIAGALGHPRVTVYRWVKGTAVPSAAKIVQLIEKNSHLSMGIFRDLLTQKNTKKESPSTRQENPVPSTTGAGATDPNKDPWLVYPYLGAYGAALQISQYRDGFFQQKGYLSRKFRLPRYTEKQSLKVFEKHELVENECGVKQFNPRIELPAPASSRSLLVHQRFWLTRTLAELQTCQELPADYKVFSGHYAVSKETQSNIFAYLKEVQQHIMALVQEDQKNLAKLPSELLFVHVIAKNGFFDGKQNNELSEQKET